MNEHRLTIACGGQVKIFEGCFKSKLIGSRFKKIKALKSALLEIIQNNNLATCFSFINYNISSINFRFI